MKVGESYMLSTSLKIAIIVALLIYFTLLFYLLKQKRLTLRYTLLWLFTGLVLLTFVAFPQLLEHFTEFVGIELQSNALFAILFFCTLIILVSLTSIISKQAEQIKHLIQYTALLEERIRGIESQSVNQ